MHGPEAIAALPSIIQVAPGVFAYVQMDGSWGLNNTGFVVGPDAVIAIDACFTERRTRALIDAISVTAPGLPVRMLVNTHHHGDHTFGNWLFAPQATIVGHDRCRSMILREGTAAHGLFPGVEWGEFGAAPPTVTFDGRLDLWSGDMKVELITVAPAHTDNDIVAWLPEQRLLFAGDVVFNGGMPFALAGSVQGWLDACDRLRTLAPRTIVPGHGAVCGPEIIDDVGAYMEFVLETAQRGFAAGTPPLALAQETQLGRFASLLDGERFVANLHRAYSELRGEPRATPLPPQAITDMIAYNGGERPRCLA